MAKEIERKFLVRNDGWRAGAEGKSILRQGYIASMDDRSVRVRVLDDKKARLTISETDNLRPISRDTMTR